MELPPLSSFVNTTAIQPPQPSNQNQSVNASSQIPSLDSFIKPSPEVQDNYDQVNQTGGFASQTIQNAQDYSSKTDQDIGESMMKGALSPFSSDDVVSNPTKAIGSTALNTVSDAWSIAKGLVTLPWHIGDFIDQVEKDPTLLLGPAAQQLVTGIESSSQTGDWSNLWKGIKGSANALVNHPLLSTLPILGGVESIIGDEGAAAVTDAEGNIVKSRIPPSGVLNTLRELGTTPIKSTIDAYKNAATDAGNLITNTIDRIKGLGSGIDNPMSILNKGNLSPAKQKAILTQQADQFDNIIKPLQDEVTTGKQALANMTNASKEDISTAQSAISEAQTKLDNAVSIRDALLDSHMNSAGTRAQVGSVGVPPEEMGQTVGTILDSAQNDVKNGYENTVPRDQFPSLKPIIDGLKAFQEEMRQSTNASLKKAIQSKIDELSQRETDTNVYKNAPSAQDAERILRNNAKMRDAGFAPGEASPPISSSFIKTTLQGELRDALVGNNSSYGKAFDNHVQPGIDKAITGDMNPSQETAYRNLDSRYKALDNGSLAGKFSKATNVNSLIKLMSDPEIASRLETVHPGIGDMIRQSILKDTIDSTKDDPDALVKKLDDRQNVLNPDDYHNVRSIAEAMQKSNIMKETAESNLKDIGGDPEEILSNIKKIKSVEDLKTFAKQAGIGTSEVFKVAARAIAEQIDPSMLNGKTPLTVETLNNILKYNEEIQQLAKDSIRSANPTDDLRSQGWGKDGLDMLDQLDKNSKIIKKALGSKTSSGLVRIAKIAGSAILASMSHYVGAAYLVKSAFLGGGKFGEASSIAEDEAALEASKAPKPKGPVRTAVTKVLKPTKTKIQIGTAGANAGNE